MYIGFYRNMQMQFVLDLFFFAYIINVIVCVKQEPNTR